MKRQSINLGADGLIFIVIAAALLVVISSLQYDYMRDKIINDLETQAQNELSAKNMAIVNNLSRVESAINNHIWDVERQLSHPDSMFSVTRRIVEQNPDIKGSSVSFIPDYYPSKGRWFECYSVRDSTGTIEMMQLGSEKHDYTQSEFFYIPISGDSTYWTNPYFDSDGAKMLLTTFSQPIHDRNGDPVGVLIADMSLEWLDSVVNRSYISPSTYNILVSRTGRLISYPRRDYIMNRTILDIAKETGDTLLQGVGKSMVSGESGQAVIRSVDGKKFYVFYAPIGNESGWSLATITSEEEILGDFYDLRRLIIGLSLLGLAILAFLIIRSVYNTSRLQRVTVKQQTISRELEIAREIQMGMLPSPVHLPMAIEPFEIAATLSPAKEVGGDLYDYLFRDGELIFCIGDVSGKGVPAALLMSVIRSLFRSLAESCDSPSSLMTSLNRSVSTLEHADMFSTLFIGFMREDGILRYCNAGHNNPLIISDKKVAMLSMCPNIPVGVLEDFQYKGEESQLPSDSVLFLYTDGITEAMDIRKNEYGENRLLDLVSTFERRSGVGLSEMVKLTLNDVSRFVGNAEQSDDMTLMLIRLERKQSCLTIQNDLESIELLNEFLKQMIPDKELLEAIRLPLEEAIVNVIEYAYTEGTKGSITVEYKESDKEISFIISDRGMAFNPLEAVLPDVTLDADERSVGGLGIFLVRQMMDKVEYIRKDGENRLTLTKRIK